MRELLRLPTKLLRELKTTRPNSDLKLTGYRVEEVQLPQSLTAEIRGQQVVVNKAARDNPGWTIQRVRTAGSSLD